MTTHLDYMDYTALAEVLAEVDTVFWAIGTSARNVDDAMYGRIHVDFPLEFVKAWREVRPDDRLLFHYVSGAGAAADSMMHWAREKERAERELAAYAEGSKLRVISYRPSAVVPTSESRGIGGKLVGVLFGAAGQAVVATEIGEAMLRVNLADPPLENGTILENNAILELRESAE